MTSTEFNAATVQMALERASRAINVPLDELDYEVLDGGSEGFLGIGVRDARVLVNFENEFGSTPEEPAAEEPAPRIVEEAPEPAAYLEDVSEDSPKESEGYEPEESDRDGDVEVLEPASEELLESVRTYITSLLEYMDLETEVDVYDTEECIAVDLRSEHTALLIGQKGETIDSLQHLVNSAVYRDQDFTKRIILDSEGYRQRRIEAVQGMAHRTARKALREGQDVKMPPMNSSERRTVHLYLKDDERVETHSEGEGSERCVVVSPL